MFPPEKHHLEESQRGDFEKPNPAQGGDIMWEHSVGKWFHFLEKCCSSRLKKKDMLPTRFFSIHFSGVGVGVEEG